MAVEKNHTNRSIVFVPLILSIRTYFGGSIIVHNINIIILHNTTTRPNGHIVCSTRIVCPHLICSTFLILHSFPKQTHYYYYYYYLSMHLYAFILIYCISHLCCYLLYELIPQVYNLMQLI